MTKTSQVMFRLEPEVAQEYRACLDAFGCSIQQHLEQHVLATIQQCQQASKTAVDRYAQEYREAVDASNAGLEPRDDLDPLLAIFREQGIQV